MKTRYIFAALISLGIFFLVKYLTIPTMAFNFWEIWVLIFFSLIIFCIVCFKVKNVKERSTAFKVAGGFLTVYLMVLLGYALFGSSVLFHTKEYRNLIGKVDEGKFNADMEPISLNDIRIVDEESAQMIGDKLLGSDPAIGSRVNHGDYILQRVKDKLYWVSPLVHSGFWKWKNNEGTPGYVMVSATNPEDARLVEKAEGKDILIKYQPEAFFSDELERHIRANGYAGEGLTDFTFEIDDNLHPYWVVSTYKHSIGFGGNIVTGVLVVDPGTGIISPYTIEKAPSWIDRIQPLDLVGDQINDWGELVNGYWNWSNTGKLKVTDQTLSLVYGSDGNCYFYTGITSVGKDNGTIGFMLVNSRTRNVKLYKQPGATESSSQISAEGKVQQMGYKASYPIMYNIEGVPTYVMSLKDKGGLVKNIAMVSVTDYSIVGTGADVQEALNDYKSNSVSKGNQITPSGKAEDYSIKTTVARINSSTVNGNTEYYLILNNYPDKIFIGRASLSKELPVTQPGDMVEIVFSDSKSESVNLSSFDNLEFNLQKTSEQITKEIYFKSVDSTHHAANNLHVVNSSRVDSTKMRLMKQDQTKPKK